MILERRRDVNISLIISSAPVNTSLLSPPADCRSSEADSRRKENVWISAFQQGVWPRGHRAGAGGVFGCLGRERRRWCEWRPEVLLSILQVPRTAPTKGDQSIKVEKPQLWSGQ